MSDQELTDDSEVGTTDSSEGLVDIDEVRREVSSHFGPAQLRGHPIKTTDDLSWSTLASRSEATAILGLSVPIFVSQLALFGMGVATNMFVGRVEGPDALAAAALATTYMWATAFLGLAPTFGMDTLVSQAYGAKSFRSVGTILQTALLVESLTAIPIAILWFSAEPVLVAIGQDRVVCALAQKYMRVFSVCLLPLLYSRAVLRYMVNQGIVWPGLTSNIASLVVCIAANAFFVAGLGWGVEGAALANALSWWFNFVSMTGIMIARGLHRRTWFGWTREAWAPNRLFQYLKFGCGGGAMVFMEVIGFEASTILSGVIGPTALDAHSITMNYLLLSFAFALGLSEAAGARVGNLMGEGRPTMALASSRTALVIVLVNSIINASLFILTRNFAGRAFTEDEEVLSLTSQTMAVAAILTVLDMFQSVLGGILRGVGRASLASAVNGLGYYLVSLPLQIVLAFVAGMGVVGIWWAMGVGLVIIFLGYAFLYFRIDWMRESENAVARSNEGVPAEKYSSVGEESDTTVLSSPLNTGCSSAEEELVELD